MYVNRADRGQPHAEVVDLSCPLLITSVGHYRLRVCPTLHTYRPQGRKDYQLVLVMGGCAYLTIDGEERVLTPGQAVLYRPDEPQDYRLCAQDQAEVFWAHFTGYAVEEMLEGCGISPRDRVFSAQVSSDYHWLFSQMIRELQMKLRHCDAILAMNLRHVLLLLNRRLPEEMEVGNEMLGEIENAIRHFNMHYHWDIQIKAYAESHLMTPYWFSQNFKKVTGSSPAQYVINLRITNAMNLLDNTDYSIIQVAAAVGYENTQYFHRLFRKHTGMTPSEYRQRKR